VGFRSLRENIDTTTAGGRLVSPPVRGAGPIRAGDHPGPDSGQADRGAGTRARRGPAVKAHRRAGPAGPQDVRRAGADRRADRRRAGGEPHLDLPGARHDDTAGTPGCVRTGSQQAGGATTTSGAEAAATLPTQLQTSADGAKVVGRSRGRSRWFVVQADPADPEHGPVAVLSGHTSQQAATAASGRARSRAASGVGEGVLLQVRAAGQISSPVDVGQPGRTGRRTARAAAVTARLTAARCDRSQRT